MNSSGIAQNGWTAVPIDAGRIFHTGPYLNTPNYINLETIKFPSQDPIVLKTQEHVETHLLKQTYNHSMRVYCWSTVILRQQFPEHAATLSPSTLALACLLHDIGTTEHNMNSTRLSFEFQGGFQALNLLGEYGSTKDQAEAVCETIIRHQDLGTEGNITFLGQLIQLSTIYDNVGDHPSVKDFDQIIHEKTREEVNKAFPRDGWLGCFAETIRKEETMKPWCHTTHIPDFAEKVEGNKLMRQYE
ncbi:HD domain-containing protein [Fusarium falciforme]|uniref:HD domain-containing protein n=1 Tax=Fusarium falciforme TaxID=195108 RepID=UPI0023009C4A|nr:HD domain-containing protein [Fusarium falciforme]WAO96159.1 HD domain-containing protein [Fusarium falciforme]